MTVTLKYVVDHFEPQAIERLHQLQRQANVQLLAERHGLRCELEQLEIDGYLSLVIEVDETGRVITLLDELRQLGYLDRLELGTDDPAEEAVLAAYQAEALPGVAIFKRHSAGLLEA